MKDYCRWCGRYTEVMDLECQDCADTWIDLSDFSSPGGVARWAISLDGMAFFSRRPIEDVDTGGRL